jgi:ribosomal protein S18 acetylase RimI-like enzyme
MSTDTERLDNPVWYSLSETHQDFALSYKNIKFYHPDYCPFGGFMSDQNISTFIEEYSKLPSNFFIVGEKPSFVGSLYLKNQLVCVQMVLSDKIKTEYRDEITKINSKYADELFQLVNLVQPGYFKEKTFLLGDYYGIFKNNRLVAVTGERMKMNGYSEVSAVITHPDHIGKGYAKQLVSHTANTIFDQDKIPYLHVTETNSPAINLYKRLGFLTRRKVSFWNFIRQST